MSLEVLSTVASIGTFVVIGATAIAALIQLRHMRSSNQIAALNEVRETLESERFAQARRDAVEIVPKLISNAAGRAQLGSAPPMPQELESIRMLANFFENVGAFVRYGIIDRELACDVWSFVVVDTWENLEPAIAIRRERFPQVWTNFEWLAVICEDWQRKHPNGAVPLGQRRKPFSERARNAAATWLAEQDEKT
jgi:Domain of unknown function (DUF4760)